MYTDFRTIVYRPIVPQFICLVLALLLIWQLTTGINKLWFTKNEPANQNAEQVDVGNEEAPDQNKGLQAYFFGEFVPKDLTVSNVKRSMLDMDVVGIIFAKDEKDSQVILRTATGEEKPFGVGDSLPGGAVMKRITPEGVLVNSNGELESLSFPKNELIFGKPPIPLNEEEK